MCTPVNTTTIKLLLALSFPLSGIYAESPSYSCKDFRYPTISPNYHVPMYETTINGHKISFRDDITLDSNYNYNCDSTVETNADSSVILVNWKCLGNNNGYIGATNSYLLRISKQDGIDTLYRLRNLNKIHTVKISHDTIQIESAGFYGRKACTILHEYIQGKSEKLCPTICEEENETVEFNKDEFSGILKRTKRYLKLSETIDRMSSKEYNRRKNHFKHNYYSE